MNILLTGSRGLLGSSILAKLRCSNHTLLTPSRLELDLSNYDQIRVFIERQRPDFVIHCAAKVGGISGNMDDPIGYLSENLRADFNLMSICADLRIERFLYFGSSCMYPININSLLEKQQLLSGPIEKTNEPYALAKISGWKMTELVSSSLRLPWKTWILSNLFGPGDHFEANRSHLLAAIIKKVSEANRFHLSNVEMWGSGKSRREFTFVEDVADYIATIVDDFEALPQTLNLGFGKDETIENYYRTVFKIYDYQGSLIKDLSKPEGVFSKLMDSSEATKYGWAPSTDIETGLEKTISWFERRLEGTSNE